MIPIQNLKNDNVYHSTLSIGPDPLCSNLVCNFSFSLTTESVRNCKDSKSAYNQDKRNRNKILEKHLMSLHKWIINTA